MKMIHWAGDWLLDEYLYGRLQGARFVLEHRELLAGGALLAGRFLRELHGLRNIENLYSPQQMLRLVRYVQDNQVLLEHHQYDWHFQGNELELSRFYNDATAEPTYLVAGETDGLLLSFYDKGMAQVLQDSPPGDKYRVAVVDCRYREYDIRDLQAACKIWHATGAELDWTYGRDYDFIVHTNGPEEICIYRNNKRGIEGEYVTEATVGVQPIVNKSTCGAGDAFSAALCSLLVSRTTGDIRAEDIIGATELAAQYVQERILACSSPTICP